MNFELFLDILVSSLLLAIYHADQQSLVYACDSGTPVFAPVHREFYDRTCSPDDYDVTSYVVQPDDEWVVDPMDTPVLDKTQLETDDLDLAQLFAMADAIVPMEAEVAAELAALNAQVDALCPVGSGADAVVAMLQSFASPVSTGTKSATVPQLRSLAVELGLVPAGKKAELNEMVLNAFANRGISTYEVAGVTFAVSSGDTVMTVLT